MRIYIVPLQGDYSRALITPAQKKGQFFGKIKKSQRQPWGTSALPAIGHPRARGQSLFLLNFLLL